MPACLVSPDGSKDQPRGAINREKGGLTVLAKKSEHHGGDHAVRIVPICPELRAILADAFEQAEPGSSLVVPSAARATVNLRTHLERIITKAGHRPWPRLLQNLRASCETDWVEEYPAHVVASWLGHSPKVAAQHYFMSREHHFEDVVSGSPKGAVMGPAMGQESGPGGASSCDAKCASIATRIATPQASASGSTEPHEKTEPVATTRVPLVLRKLRQFPEPARGRTPRKKQPALAMEGSAGVKWRGQDSNLRPRGYEPRELPGCSTPRHLGGRDVRYRPDPASRR